MNERIKKLAEQAHKEGNEYKLFHIDLEKFAELIIRECAQVIDNADSEGRLDDFAIVYLGEHFGVE